MKKILIVDDQDDIRELVKITLDIGDYDIIQASNGPTALELTKTQKPDLILLDVMMPEGGMDGFEVCKEIKNNPEFSDTTIIMLTAKSQESDKEQGLLSGADGYFTKPFSPLALMNKVDEIFGE